MAIVLRLKPKWRRLNPKPTATHFFSSDSKPDSKQPTSDFPSFREIKDAARKNPSSSQNPNEETPSPFADIKSHLRSKFPPPPRRSFNNPPSPLNDALFPQRSSAPSSMEEIRRHLQEFKPTVLSNSRKPESQEIRADPSFKAISESLRTIRENDRRNVVNHTVGKGFGSAGLSLYNLGAKPDPLPLSIFGREIKEKEKATEEMELVKVYNYRELGEKMRALRSSSKEKKGESFSLGNLGERLKKLRGIEEKQRETEPKIGGFSAKDLQDSLYKKMLPRRPSMPLPGAGLLGQLGMQSTPSYMLAPPQEHLVEKYFHPDNMSSQEKLKLELQRVREEFKMSESDCGSTRVQVALLTTKIKHLSTALHKKDKHSRRGLQAMVQKRKKLLKYLRRTDWDSYTLVLSKLGLRDNPEVKA